LELGVRSAWPNPATDKGYPQDLLLYDDVLGYKNTPNFEGYFPIKGSEEVKISINSKGLRDYEHSYEGLPDRFRILVLGDSITFGSGIRFEEMYSTLLEKKLNENNYDVEIIKAGVTGYEFSQMYDYYSLEGKKYSPDMVIYGAFLNDIFEPNITKRKELNDLYGYPDTPRENLLVRIIKKTCQSCIMLYSIILNYNERYFELLYSTWEDEEALSNYFQKIRSLEELLEKNNTELILVVFPYTFQFENGLGQEKGPQEKIKEFGRNEDIPVIDLLDYLDTPNYKEIYLQYDRVHPNEKGNEIVAEAIYRELTEKYNHTLSIK